MLLSLAVQVRQRLLLLLLLLRYDRSWWWQQWTLKRQLTPTAIYDGERDSAGAHNVVSPAPSWLSLPARVEEHPPHFFPLRSSSEMLVGCKGAVSNYIHTHTKCGARARHAVGAVWYTKLLNYTTLRYSSTTDIGSLPTPARTETSCWPRGGRVGQ